MAPRYFWLDDKYGRLAVADDVDEFARGQAVVQQCQRHARAGDAIVALDIFRAVFRQDRHFVAGRGDLKSALDSWLQLSRSCQ